MQFDSSLSLASSLRPQRIFRGLIPTLLRDVPFSGIYWTSFETIKKRLEPCHTSTFIAGAVSGILAAALTTPFDVVKTRIQIGKGTGGVIHVFKKVANEGGLFKGLGPRVARVAPACAVMIWAYEAVGAFYWDMKGR